jgi:hypothetical protein
MLGHLANHVIHHRLPLRRRNALGLVEQVHDRQPVADLPPLRLRQAADHTDKHQRAQNKCEDPARPSQPRQALKAEHPQQRQQQQQREIPGFIEAVTGHWSFAIGHLSLAQPHPFTISTTGFANFSGQTPEPLSCK